MNRFKFTKPIPPTLALTASLLLHGFLLHFFFISSFDKKPLQPFQEIPFVFLGITPEKESPNRPAPVEALAERTHTTNTPQPEELAPPPASLPPPTPPARPKMKSPSKSTPIPTKEPVLDSSTPIVAQALPDPPLNLTPSLKSLSDWDKERAIPSDKVASIDLNTQEVRYAAFLKSVKDRVEQGWSYPTQAKEENLHGSLFIAFTINKEGQLEKIELIRSSGSPILDQAALAAVKNAAPFPPLPNSWNLDRVRIKTTFEYIMRGFRWGRGFK
ncbi:MAG: energy transducer TonB [Magnetococcus sp. DMHC-6]